MSQKHHELKDKLKKDIEETDWSPLIQHHQQGAVFVVDGIELLDAAVAIAQDRIDFIKIWLDSAALRKPTKEEVEKWDSQKNIKLARFIIIQPYVLIELIKN